MPRRPMTKEAKIRRALEAGVSVSEIARRYHTSPQYVNVIRRKHFPPRPVQAEPTLVPVQEHSVGPLPPAPRAEPAPAPAPAHDPYFASGLVSLHPEPPQPTAGISSIPLGAGEVRELAGPPKPTLWQRFKLWFWGRA
jgi:hypothetical protein